jgi:hypothetical protein
LPQSTRCSPRCRFADRRTGGGFGGSIGGVFRRGLAVEPGDPHVDLARLEADDLDAEVELGKREVLELLGQEPFVPLRGLGEPIVGDHQGAAFLLAQPLDRDRRDLRPAEFAAGLDPAMPGNDFVFVIDQRRHRGPEGPDRTLELLDLLLRVMARVLRIGLQLVEPAVDDFEPRAPLLGGLDGHRNIVRHQCLLCRR